MDPVTEQKICRRNIKQTEEIFSHNLQSTFLHHCSCKWILRVSLLSLAWQFFADSDPYILISMAASYCHLDIELQAEFPGWVAFSTCEIVGGVVRDCDLVVYSKFFPVVFVGDSSKIFGCKNFLLYGTYITTR